MAKRDHDGDAAEEREPKRAAAAGAPAGAPALPPRKPSRRVAMLVAYCGAGYSGLQRNANIKAVEDDLIAAACAAGCVPASKVDDLRSMWWSRAARTDKGVHALANVISFQCQLENGASLDAVAAQLNEALPAAVRVLGLRRVTKSFDAHRLCDSRLYDYLVPVRVLRGAPAAAAAAEPAAGGAPAADAGAALSEEETARLNALLRAFVGTHAFHNYTSGLPPGSPQAKRYILDVRLAPAPTLRGERYVALRFHGASFLLHQIRKMAAVTLARAHGWLDDSQFAATLSAARVPVPIAPPGGLLLRGCEFGEYNRRFGVDPARGTMLPVAAEEAAREAFCEAHILPVVGSDANAAELAEFMQMLPSFDWDKPLVDFAPRANVAADAAAAAEEE